MKIVIAMMQHETNTFSLLPTNLDAFSRVVGLQKPPSDKQAIDLYGDADMAFAGLLDIARSYGVECIVPIAAYAEPSGIVDDDAFNFICKKICAAVKNGCDAILLDLHGAMVTESYDDGEGELLRRIRKTAPEIPIAVALDFHANVTATMVENCNVIDGYRTYPHIDMRETGARAAKSLLNCLDQGIETKICWQSLPMMTHMMMQATWHQPMKDIMELAIEGVNNTDILNVSVFGGFAYADIPHVSLSVLTVEPVKNHLGKGLVSQICAMAWERRYDFIYKPLPLSDSIEKAKKIESYPVLIVDHGDNTGSGGSADDMSVLDEMLRQGLSGIIVGPIRDPEAVDRLIDCGEGNEMTLTVGGKFSVPSINQIGHGLNCKGIVKKVTDGCFTITSPVQTGLKVCLGRTVVFDIGLAKIVLCEEGWEPYGPELFIHAGLIPEESQFMLIKSRVHFRAGFESITSNIIMAAGPGVCSSDYSQFKFSRLPKPMFPFDKEMELEKFNFYKKSEA